MADAHPRAATVGHDRSAVLASQLEATPPVPGLVAGAYVAGVVAAAIATVTFALRATGPQSSSPAVLELTVPGAIAGMACFVAAIWLATYIRGRSSVLKPLTRDERRAVRRAATGRESLDAGWAPIVAGYGREVRESSAQLTSVLGILAITTMIWPATTGWRGAASIVQLVAVWALIVIEGIQIARYARARG